MANPPAPPAPILGIRDLHRRVAVAISREMRGPVWVRAEIDRVYEHNGHCFITLAEPARDATETDATLDVVAWRPAWARIRRRLEERAIGLRPGLTVTLRGELVMKDGAGLVQLRASDLDTDALLGEVAARRMALKAALAAEGLLEANGRRILAPLPLAVGVVASPASQGYRDLRGVLDGSGFRFALHLEAVVVQGLAAPAAVASAVARLAGSAVDVIVVVRGGGARADLDAFDSEAVARAVAASPVPVWTGLGHTGDRCLADEVAHTSHATPTACAHALVALVRAAADGVAGRASRLGDLAERTSAAAAVGLAARRRLLSTCAASHLGRHHDRAVERAGVVRRAAARALHRAEAGLAATAARLPPTGLAALDRRGDRLAAAGARLRSTGPRALARDEGLVSAHRRVLAALDPDRQLERGWTLTLDADGALVRRAAAVRAGQRLITRFADGERASVVEA